MSYRKNFDGILQLIVPFAFASWKQLARRVVTNMLSSTMTLLLPNRIQRKGLTQTDYFF